MYSIPRYIRACEFMLKSFIRVTAPSGFFLDRRMPILFPPRPPFEREKPTVCIAGWSKLNLMSLMHDTHAASMCTGISKR